MTNPTPTVSRYTVASSSRRSATLLIIAASLIASPNAPAYEKDIHFSATLAIAIAVGWPPEDAQIIASANQGLDENKSTIAALEFDVLTSVPTMIYGQPYFVRGPIHQANKNFWLHCFSKIPDKLHKVEANVEVTVSGHLREFDTTVQNDVRAVTKSHPWVDSLVALGVALHCQQDSQSHNNYGGLCPKDSRQFYPGSCYGHLIDSAKHRHSRLFRKASNPDHPAVRSENDLFRALDFTRHILDVDRKKHAPHFSTPPGAPGPTLTRGDVQHLTKLLSDPSTLKLSDTERVKCNHEVIGAWLFDVSKKSGQTPKAVATNAVSKKCKAAFPSLFQKSARVLLPSSSYPQLTDMAKARRASSGPYLTVDAQGAADLKVEEISHEQRDCNSIECTYSYKVRVSNKSQFWSASGYLLLAVVPIDDKRPGFGIKVPLDKIAPGGQIEIPAHTKGPRQSDYVVYADIQPAQDQVSEWRDTNVLNDSGTCLFQEGKILGNDSKPAKENDDSDDGPLCGNLKTKNK